MQFAFKRPNNTFVQSNQTIGRISGDQVRQVKLSCCKFFKIKQRESQFFDQF